MPRYFFHSVTNRREHDIIGTELADDPTARREAIRFAASVIRDQPDLLEYGLDYRVEVTNDAGSLLYLVSMAATEISAPGQLATPAAGNVVAIQERHWQVAGGG